jgi:hypothetical protein
MSQSQDPAYDPDQVLAKPRVSFWRKLGGGSLAISLIIHGIILAVGVVLIVGIIPPPPEKVVDFMAPGGGGAPQSSQQQKKRANVVKSNASRVAAKDVVSNFTLPDPEASSDMSALGALGAGGMGGLGGLGSGAGLGDGMGAGIGAGIGTGFGAGSGSNPFGMINPNAGALEGNFYDLKQTAKREPTNLELADVKEAIRDFVTGGWREKQLEKYYKAKKPLYQTKLYIPVMPASGAPEAFNSQNEVQPSRWIVVYRGTVTPPKSGKYRFVGVGDDVLVVRFNGKHVFDYGYTRPTSGTRDDLMEQPLVKYQYEATTTWNKDLQGIGRGPEFRAEAGKAYPIEILMSELPGGLFGAVLMIEEVGVQYQKDPLQGAPILPLFRLDPSAPKQPSKDTNAPPFDPKGPVWRTVEDGGKLGI